MAYCSRHILSQYLDIGLMSVIPFYVHKGAGQFHNFFFDLLC